MKTVIRGKVYDTDNAELVLESHGGDGLAWYRESLYETPDGFYFMVCSGGPASVYHASIGVNQWASSSKIKAMSKKSVKAWKDKVRERKKYYASFWDWAHAQGHC